MTLWPWRATLHGPEHAAAIARSGAPSSRRVPALLLAGLLLVSAMALVTFTPDQDYENAYAQCGNDGQAMPGVPGPAACSHVDEPPAGVDVTEHVSTAELQDRVGGGPAAVAAAEELGAPTTVASTATTPAVPCSGDGTSGYRVQAMYVVEAGRPNRFDALQPNLKLWAAGTDDVVNRSAALTGGVRNLRYVTEPGAGGTCEAKVLNVTVPAGSTTSFGSTISAVQALGYSAPARKYMMWTDASMLCGVALMYLSDAEGQGNPNNGSYPQYARIDSGCWGLGNGTNQHSVEAHEIVHTLGGVQSAAPHGTNAGHCWDEYDAMCYSDGTSHAMVQVCPVQREYLLDCNTDDYFSTYPDPGSYLATHWNSASSRFLIGGGDGTGGGQAGSPTVLGATIGVNNPAVPGLSTQVSVAPSIPDGRTLTSVTWTSAQRGCSFSNPTEIQSTVTCPATSAAATSVTVQLADSSGATKKLTSPLTFATGTARPVSVTLGVASQDGTPASVCTGAAFPVTATVTDAASGLPVKGLAASFTKQTPAMTSAAAAGRATSLVTGEATLNGTATISTRYAASVLAGTVFAAGSSAVVTAVPQRCAVALTGEASSDRIYYGDPITASGTLTRTVAGTSVPVGGASVPVRLTYEIGGIPKVLTLATARTASDGTWSVVVKPTVSGALWVSVPSSVAYEPAFQDLGPVAVDLPTTDLTAALDRSNVGYGTGVVVTGVLSRTAGVVVTGVAGATVAVKIAAAGKPAVTVAAGRTLTDGTYAVTLPLKLSGALSVVYAGSAGLPADSIALGEVTAGTWSTATLLQGTPSGTALVLSGTVSRTYGDLTENARSVKVKLWFTPTSTGVPALAGTVTTTATGAFTLRVTPRATGGYTAVTSANLGHTDSSSAVVPVTVG